MTSTPRIAAGREQRVAKPALLRHLIAAAVSAGGSPPSMTLPDRESLLGPEIRVPM
jgi:hypothetical protein